VKPVFKDGSREHAAFVVYQCAAGQGYSGLKLNLLVAIARYGGHCYRKNSDLAQKCGTLWKTSIWRVAHQLASEKLLRLERVLPGQRPQGVRRRYPEGRSSKFLDFHRLGCPEAVEDWRRPDTATRETPERRNGRSGAPKRPRPKRPLSPTPPPREPEPAPDLPDADEVAELSAKFLTALTGRPPKPKR